MHKIEAPADYSFQQRLTRDSDEHAESLKAWDQIYDQLSPGPFAGKVVDVWFKGL